MLRVALFGQSRAFSGEKGVDMEEFVTLTYNGHEIKLPVVTGSEGEKAVDHLQPAGRNRLHHPGPPAMPTPAAA